MTKTYISVADTAKIVRKAIAEKFPGVKFSVRSDSYSGGASIDVTWQDGPTEAAVKEVTDHFTGADFDPMQDLKSYHSSVYQGQEVHFGADFIFPKRTYSQEVIEKVAAATFEKTGIAPLPIERYDRWPTNKKCIQSWDWGYDPARSYWEVETYRKALSDFSA